MSQEKIIQELKNIFKLVVNPNADVDNVSLDADIVKDLGVGSVGLIYLVVGIEETFKIDMSDVTFNTFKTIKEVVEYIEKKVK